MSNILNYLVSLFLILCSWLEAREQVTPPLLLPSHRTILTRDLLIWQIEEYLYPTSILGMIYHIRADAFIFFGL